ncbi:cob(I)yrinic acid a,c-diamide adenosyltransferase [Candidatus Latescibacterota bacterium]
MVIVHTGLGKGKTTAALGMVMRAWGHGMRIGVIQFIKSPEVTTGEARAARSMEVDWTATGDGFTWEGGDLAASRDQALRGWELAQDKVTSGDYDVLILDEFAHPLSFGWIDPVEVVEWLQAHRPAPLHVIITGAVAPPELVDYADLVTEMRLVKHPYADRGVPAQRGIEF